ncbi:hypothetical protein TUMSATVNIG3_33720 [Vibrio nigripulchritudo]|nr:hypothetical protein TUMSATVNIG2_33230 [Vibrio nigripulchritudo]BDU44574.1 hypothetical protein TUMSATVNIG3_33720 [Vibrio nigripulchritudo]
MKKAPYTEMKLVKVQKKVEAAQTGPSRVWHLWQRTITGYPSAVVWISLI